MRKKDDSFQVSPDEFKNRIREHWNRPETRNPNTSRFAMDEEERAWKSFFSKEIGEEKQRVLDVVQVSVFSHFLWLREGMTL